MYEFTKLLREMKFGNNRSETQTCRSSAASVSLCGSRNQTSLLFFQLQLNCCLHRKAAESCCCSVWSRQRFLPGSRFVISVKSIRAVINGGATAGPSEIHTLSPESDPKLTSVTNRPQQHRHLPNYMDPLLLSSRTDGRRQDLLLSPPHPSCFSSPADRNENL